MKNQLNLIVVAKWQQLMNERNVVKILELTEETIEIVGPKGSVCGRQSFVDWIQYAGLTLTTLKSYVNEDKLVLKQHALLKDDAGQIKKESIVYTYIIMKNGKVASLTYFYNSQEAEESSGISLQNETI